MESNIINSYMEKEEHTNCGTPDCCMECDTAVPVQLELFPELARENNG